MATDSVAGVSFDLTLEENGISTAISDVSEQVKEQLEQTFQSAADSIENSVSEIQQSISDIDVDIDTSGINQAVSETENVVDELKNKINSIIADTEMSERSKVAKIASLYRQQGMDQSQAMKEAWKQIERTVDTSTDNIKNQSGTTSESIKDNVKKVKKECQSTAQAVSQKFKASLTDIKSGFDMVLGSVKNIISGSKGLMSVYQTQIEAEARLGATMRNSTGAAEEQIQSVKDLASELQGLGVIGDEVQLAGAQELATYVSTTDSIKTMLPVLDDMIAQQYGYSASTDSAVTIATMLGKVLQGQTSALSRYGYSFTKAQEKILKYGTEQERVATLAEVVNESVSGVNEALANTPTGKVKQLSNDFGDLQETMGSIITNVFSPIAKLLDKIIIKLNTALSLANQYVKQMLGIQDSNISLGGLAEDADETTDAVDDTTDSVKKLKKATAGFDQLNILSSDKSDDTNTDTSQTQNALSVPVDTSSAESSVKEVESIFDKLKRKIDSLFKNTGLAKFLDESKQKINSFVSEVWGNLQSGFGNAVGFANNIFSAFTSSANGMKEQTLQAFWGLFDGIVEFIGSISVIWSDGLATWFENLQSWSEENYDLIKTTFDDIQQIFNDVFTFIGDIFRDTGDILLDWWKKDGKKMWDSICKVVTDLGTIFLKIFNQWIKPAWDAFVKILRSAWESCIKPIFEKLMHTISKLWNDIIEPLWKNVLKPLVDWVIDEATPHIQNSLNIIGSIFQTLFDTVRGVINGALDALGGLIDFISGVFTGDWEKAWKGIGDFIIGIWDLIWSQIKGTINLIIDGINTLWSSIYYAVRGIVDGVGEIAGALGDLLGQDWHFNMPEYPPLIPKLAKGGLATAPTLALVGDNRNAKSDPEVIAPLSKLKQMIAPPAIKALSGNEDYNSRYSPKEKNGNSEILIMLNKMYELVKNQEDSYINNIYLDGEKIESKAVKVRKRKARRYNSV